MIKIADGGKLIIKIDGDTKGFYDKAGDIDKFTNKALKNIAKGAAVTTAAIAAMGTMSIKAYADYEQLVGGVDTLFKESSKKLQGYAAEAYKTAGISANTYMQNATSFSASLLSSLAGDTEKAADIANMAMIDMSDNANKMGTPMESITNAYQGFAKQQYMLLDNLKLGYGGTKTEMERLLKDAEALSGVKYDINNLADVYEAIHVIQTELGITGTTAKEASTTITGSINMAKAALDNLLVGISDPTQDIDVLVDNFVNSVGTVIDNVMPRIKAVASELSSLLIKHMPEGFKIAISAVTAFGVALVGLKIGLVVNDIANLIKGVKSFTAATELGAAAQKVMNAQLLANPYALAVTALAALTAGVAVYAATHKSAASEIRKAYDEEIKAIDDATAAEMVQAEKTLHLKDTLFELDKQLKSGTLTEKEATETKKQFDVVAGQLAETIPEITSAIYDENGAIDIQGGKVDALTASYYKLAKAKAYAAAYESKLNATIKAITDIDEKLANTPEEVDRTFNEKVLDWISFGTPWDTKVTNPIFSELEEEKNKLIAKQDEYIAAMGDYQNQITDIVGEGEKDRTNTTENGNETRTASTKKAGKEQSDILKEQQEKELRDLKFALETKKITENGYYKELAKFRDKYFQEGSDEWNNYTTEIFGYVDKLSEGILDSIEKVADEQKKLEDKLKDYGELYETVTKTSWLGNEVKVVQLADIGEQTEKLKEYSELLLKVKERGAVPAEFFSTLRDMPVDEGKRVARLLMNADDATFNQYISDWKEKQEAASELSKILYADETGQIKQEITSSFEEFNDELDLLGEDNAESWVKGFMSEISRLMPDVMSEITSAFNNLIVSPMLLLSGAAGGTATTENTFSPTYNFYGTNADAISRNRIVAKNDALLSYMRGTQ